VKNTKLINQRREGDSEFYKSAGERGRKGKKERESRPRRSKKKKRSHLFYRKEKKGKKKKKKDPVENGCTSRQSEGGYLAVGNKNGP